MDTQIADADRKVATLYDMLDAVDPTNVDAKGIPFTVSGILFPFDALLTCCHSKIRTVFVIDPKKVIRLTISYPAQTGRSFDEILRVIDSLQVRRRFTVCCTITNTESFSSETSTVLLLLSTGRRVMTLSSTLVYQTLRPKNCSLTMLPIRYVLCDSIWAT